MADSFDPGNPEHAAWERGNIRGLGVNQKRRFLRTERDFSGNEVNVYQVMDDEWADTPFWDENTVEGEWRQRQQKLLKEGNRGEQTGTQPWPTELSRWPRS